MPSPFAATTDSASFVKDVLEGSKRVPVLLDFTATWCGPCQILGPILEKLADEFAGRFQLLKIDLDENMALAQELGVASVPTVYAFRNGHPVSRFVGALPEEQVREFVRRLLPTAAEERLTQAEERMRQDPKRALSLLEEDHQARPEDEEINAVRAQALLQLGRLPEAKAAAETVTVGAQRHALAQNVLALVGFAEEAAGYGDRGACQAAVWKNPKDAEARYRLGIALAAQGENAAALAELQQAAELDPKQAHGRAKEAMVKLFQLLGADSDLAGEYRAKLATLLY